MDISTQTRRRFLEAMGLGVASLTIPGCVSNGTPGSERKSLAKEPRVPSFLKGYENLYAKNPRQANLEWLREAKYGLFIHYGLYSLLGRHEWVQYKETIPIAEYAKLKDQFTAENFDVDFITDLAIQSEMKYITFVAKHCDSFCLWDTKHTDFNSVNSPAKRDFVAELATACEKKGLGLFLFYEHGFDWRHPHGPAPWDWKRKSVRPQYDPPDPFYAKREDYNFQIYLDYVTGQVTELLTNYGPIAGIWLDGAAIPHSGDKSKFRLPELYALMRRLQPQALICYKWGVTGTEDFLAPEKPQLEYVDHLNRGDKPMEVCETLQEYGWGYVEETRHISADEVMEKINHAVSLDANLLLNTGPLPDGTIHPEDIQTLREVGRRLRDKGWPKPSKS